MITEQLKISTENTIIFKFFYEGEYTVVSATYDNITFKINDDFTIIEGDLSDYDFVDSELPQELTTGFENYIIGKMLPLKGL